MFVEESTKVERYVGGLPDMIHGSVKASKPQSINCTIASQVKFASCTLEGSALTWWNSYVRAVRQDVAYAMPWTTLKKMITDKYYPRGEIQKLESEYWNLKEHLAPADSSIVPIVDPVPPAGDTETFETDEFAPTFRSPQIGILLSQTRLRRARKTVRLEPPMSASIEACIARHAAVLSPSLLVLSPPLPVPSPLTTSPTDTGAPLGYRTVGIRMRTLLPSTSRRTNIPEANMPPRKRACLTTLALGFKVGESFAAGAARQPGPDLESGPAHVRKLEAQVAALIARTSSLQTQLTTALGRIDILEARDPEPHEGPAEAGSSC
nr:reverse transcriptase domain-containing protein [Tanacetum cinerariifolium]